MYYNWKININIILKEFKDKLIVKVNVYKFNDKLVNFGMLIIILLGI